MSLNSNDFSRKSQIEDFFSNKYILTIFIVVFVARMLAIFIPPQFTTDLARSLFYGHHFWQIGFDVYKLTPTQIDPNFSIIDKTTGLLAWPDNTYDYGIMSLLYYAIIGSLPIEISLQIIVAKVLLNVIDIVILLLLIFLFSDQKEIPLVFWIVMIPFTSIEGQPLSFTLLFFITSIYCYKNNHKNFAYIIVALGFHWKYVPLLLLPYYILNDLIIYSKQRDQKSFYELFLKQFVSFLILFLLLMFPFLFSPYIASYVSFGGNLLVTSLPWNPFYLGYPVTLSSFLLGFLVLYIIFNWFNLYEEHKTAEGLGFLPILGLYEFLMIYKYAFPWYWMWGVPLFAVMPVKKKEIFRIYLGICVIAAIEFINWTVGYPFIMHLF